MSTFLFIFIFYRWICLLTKAVFSFSNMDLNFLQLFNFHRLTLNDFIVDYSSVFWISSIDLLCFETFFSVSVSVFTARFQAHFEVILFMRECLRKDSGSQLAITLNLDPLILIPALIIARIYNYL